MKVLFIASEVAPFAKTGGLADVTGSLPKELKRLGHDVRVILPFYKTVQEGNYEISRGVQRATVQMGNFVETGILHQTSLDGIPVYFLENATYFNRDYLYGTPTADYPDNPRRYAFFCRWILEFFKHSNFHPDILHCHDWQTALVPILLKYGTENYSISKNCATLYTIHNLAYQGLFPKESLDEMGLDQSYFRIELLEYFGMINLMKGAIMAADLINTVSESYCSEIQTPELGCGLNGVLKVRQADLSGIINGLDYNEWDPSTDRELVRTFTAETLDDKSVNKMDLQRLLGLEQSPDIPLLGIVSRLSAQKGFDLIAKLLSRFAGGKMQLVILGSGEEKYVRLLTRSTAAKASNISFNFGFDSSLAHKIYAGSDILLMPSHYEPCGLGQLIALRYGTVPVVRKTGGLADTVFDPEDSAAPNGFSFSTYTPAALWHAITRALHVWQDKKSWVQIVRQGMADDFSWRHSALEYEKLYRHGMEKKGK